MSKTFWIRLTVLVPIFSPLGIYRISTNKINEQNSIAELQLYQLLAFTSFFLWISARATNLHPGTPTLFLVLGLIMSRNIRVRHPLDMVFDQAIASTLSVSAWQPQPYNAYSPISQFAISSNDPTPQVECTAATRGTFEGHWPKPVTMVISLSSKNK